MKEYNFYERNKKSIEKLPAWPIKELIDCVNLIATELADLPPNAHPDYIEFLRCAKKEFEKHIELKHNNNVARREYELQKNDR